MTPQKIEALNIAGQCRATASSPLAKNILVDEGNGLLTELLLDAARIIEALAQPEQEPVACPYCKNSATLGAVYYDQNCVGCVKRMTTTPQRKPLSDEEIDEIAKKHIAEGTRSFEVFARAIEAAHGIKE